MNMEKQLDQSIVHCNDCQFEGKVHASGAKQFGIFMLILFSSAYFLPMIIVALAYMVYILSQSPKRMCPKCKSTNLTAIGAIKAKKTAESSASTTQTSSDQTA
jgi:hypothetical protein